MRHSHLPRKQSKRGSKSDVVNHEPEHLDMIDLHTVRHHAILPDITNLVFDELEICMETPGGDTSWINGNNERHNISIHYMVMAGLLYSNKHENKWYYSAETSAEVHRCIIHSDLENISPHFSWYGQKTSIH